MSAERIDPESLRQEIVEAKVLKWPSYCVAIPRLERLLAVVDAALALSNEGCRNPVCCGLHDECDRCSTLRAALAPFRKELANG